MILQASFASLVAVAYHQHVPQYHGGDTVGTHHLPEGLGEVPPLRHVLVELGVTVPGGAVRVEVGRQGQEAQLGKQLERERGSGLGFHSSVTTDLLFEF